MDDYTGELAGLDSERVAGAIPSGNTGTLCVAALMMKHLVHLLLILAAFATKSASVLQGVVAVECFCFCSCYKDGCASLPRQSAKSWL